MEPDDAGAPTKAMDGRLQMREIHASLPLAVAVHFNSYFSVAYAVLVGRAIFAKVHLSFSDELQRSVLLPAFVVWWVAEALRLHLGQYGNVEERVSKLAAFLLLSIFPQIPIVGYLGYYQDHIIPLDPVLGSLMLALLGFQIVVGYRAMRSMIRLQTEEFYRSYQDEKNRKWQEKQEEERDILFFTQEFNDEC